MAAFVGGTGVSYPVPLTQIGFAIETTRGTLMAEPSYMEKPTQPAYKPNQTYLPDDTLQGSMVQTYAMVQGLRDDQHGWSSYPRLDSFPVKVCAELGSADTTQAAITATTLSTSATAGATTVSVTGTVTQGDVIVIDTGTLMESHIAGTVTGAGPYVVTLDYPLLFSHASTAPVTGLTAHRFSLLNTGTGQPPSLSIWDYDGEQWRTMTAGQLDELNVKGNVTGLIDTSCTLFGNAASLNASAPSTSFTSIKTAAPWTTQILLGGTKVVTALDWEIDLKRQVEPIPAVTGTQEYFQYFAGAITSTGKLTFVEQSGSPYLADYEAGTVQSLDITFFDPATGDLCNIHSSNALFTTGALDRSKKYVTVPCDVQLLPSSTDATAGGQSPLVVTIGNSVVTAYH